MVMPSAPEVFTAASHGAEQIVAIDHMAHAMGLSAGMRLADARALVPELIARSATPDHDRRALSKLSYWCLQFSPWVRPETAREPVFLPGAACLFDYGLNLDISGSDHLFGGEEKMTTLIQSRLNAFSLTAHLAIADCLGAAWALARFATEPNSVTIMPPGSAKTTLANLPLAALRLQLQETEDLARLGLRQIRDLYKIPRAAISQRFGPSILRRLDQALGFVGEPLSPDQETSPLWCRMAFAEPIAHPDDIARASEQLCEMLCTRLAKDGLGVLRLRCSLFLAEGGVRHADLGLARASLDPAHIFRLLIEHLPALEAEFGADAITLTAVSAEPLKSLQYDWALPATEDTSTAGNLNDPELGLLIDRLGNRLGMQNIARFAANESHLPERAVRVIAPLSPPDDQTHAWGDIDGLPRPVKLLPCPEMVETMAEVPDGPPMLFRWRGRMHRVIRAEGPERIAPEWWRQFAIKDPDNQTRDYFRIEVLEGQRFWLYRLGLYPEQGGHSNKPPRWYLHGFFA
jgi:protein ImuB